MLIHELIALLDGVGDIVDASPEQADLGRRLRIPEHVRYERYEQADDRRVEIGAGQGLIGLIGDSAGHTDPEVFARVLAHLQPGARALLLLGWPVEELAYHRLLGPLVDNCCQVIEVVPVERVPDHGPHCALLVERVARVAPLRPYLLETRSTDAGASDGGEAGDELQTLLRMANEFVLSDLVARTTRRRMREQDAQIAELNRKLAAVTAQLAEVEASASLQAGRAITEGMRNPGRGLLAVPRELGRVWRGLAQEARKPPPGAGADG